MDVLEAQTSVLSVAPGFDQDVAADILAGARDWLSAFEGVNEDPIATLRLAGLISESRGVMRIADPLRTQLVSWLASEHPAQYRASANTFTTHARNGFHERLVELLGNRGAAVTVAVLNTAAAESDSEQARTDELLSTLQTHASRSVDTAAAIRQLNRSPLRRTTMDRLTSFLTGLYEWRAGQHARAAEQFELVLSRRGDDRIEAIARHLLGVYRAEQRDFPASLLYLETAVDLLRKLDDTRGLAQTLTSFGRVLAASATVASASAENPDIASEQLLRATAILDEAVAIGNKLEDDVLKGRALLELARVEYASERIDTSVVLAEEAASALSHHERELLSVYVYLGTLYREAGLTDRAREVLQKAAQLASKINASDGTLARILNVQASADRRAGLTDDAIRTARESVAIGQRLSDRKHIAHALHTLAASLLDLGTPEAASDARRYLVEARALLEQLGDTKGVSMVDDTLRRASRPTHS